MTNLGMAYHAGKKYRTVVIDPPWPPSSLSLTSGLSHSKKAFTTPYKTMKISEIRDFPIDDFADEQCNLFMWSTYRFVPDSLDIIKSWGFKYSKILTWYKHNGINHQGFSCDAEPCIFAYRGVYDMDYRHPLHLVIDSPREKHSQKPVKFYHALVRSAPAPRIDIFARKRHYGFDAWGDQAEPVTNLIDVY